MATLQRLPVEDAVLDEFCRRWKIAKLELFGSAVRADFNETSDFDLLVTFQPNETWSLLDHVGMEDELSGLLGRRVDLVTRRSIEASRNPIRRDRILSTAVQVYVSE
jgi:predicted nucleotidyltransferase